MTHVNWLPPRSSTHLDAPHISDELFSVPDGVLNTHLAVVLWAVPHHVNLSNECPLPLVMHHVCQDFGALQVDSAKVSSSGGAIPQQPLLQCT